MNQPHIYLVIGGNWYTLLDNHFLEGGPVNADGSPDFDTHGEVAFGEVRNRARIIAALAMLAE